MEQNAESSRKSLLEAARLRARERKPPARRIEPADIGGPLPLSCAQQQLWLVETMEQSGHAYHVPLGFSLRGQLDAAALRHAMQRIVERHQALRTTFRTGDELPVQCVGPAAGALGWRETVLTS
ncbi:condensation domain-containing protein, partial [Rugamonas sp. A1-17]|nr:condensation domain-containing protein [Rugamonas sp. A1-17]